MTFTIRPQPKEKALKGDIANDITAIYFTG